MSELTSLGLAYGAIWLVLAIYLLLLTQRISRVQGDLRELRRRLERNPGRDERQV